MRTNNRAADSMRPVKIERNLQPNADGSILLKMGDTHVICAVSIEDKIPPFLDGSGQGWITAEYGMLPCSTNTRSRREAVSGRGGRTYEIQRLIGRCLRTMVNLKSIGERTLRVDCDVLNADGGTRTAAITGAAIAVRNVIGAMAVDGRIEKMPDLLPIAAVSVGIVGDEALLDLDYREDSTADVDGNFVMSADGRWVEIQTVAEAAPFSHENFVKMTDLARKGIQELLDFW